MYTSETLTVRKSRPAQDGFEDRGRTYHKSAGYQVVDENGTVRATIENMGGGYMQSNSWFVRTIKADGSQGLTACRDLLKDAKAKAIDLIVGQDLGDPKYRPADIEKLRRRK